MIEAQHKAVVGSAADAAGDDGRSTDEFDDFVREQYRALVTFLRRRTPTPQDAEDAAQDSFAKMLRYCRSESKDAWQRLLYRVAINTAYDKHRQALRQHASDHLPLEENRLPSMAPSPEDHAAYAQRVAQLQAAIRRLPPKRKRVYLLARVHGLSHAQVAEVCGISVKMVEKHLAAALRALRQRAGDPSSRMSDHA